MMMLDPEWRTYGERRHLVVAEHPVCGTTDPVGGEPDELPCENCIEWTWVATETAFPEPAA